MRTDLSPSDRLGRPRSLARFYILRVRYQVCKGLDRPHHTRTSSSHDSMSSISPSLKPNRLHVSRRDAPRTKLRPSACSVRWNTAFTRAGMVLGRASVAEAAHDRHAAAYQKREQRGEQTGQMVIRDRPLSPLRPQSGQNYHIIQAV